MNPAFSILTPAVPSRWVQVEKLFCELERQIRGGPVEHLVFLDNKMRTVGQKRDALLRAARGEYVAFVDDDDWIADRYVAEILTALTTKSDVVTFEQESTVNGLVGTIQFGLGNPNEGFKPGGRVLRNAWHVCAWKRQLAILSHFPAINYGEDWAFAEPLCKIAKTSIHIPKVLHYYRHDDKATEAPPPR